MKAGKEMFGSDVRMEKDDGSRPKEKRILLLYPLALFLIVFALDKLSLLPDFAKYTRGKSITRVENIRTAIQKRAGSLAAKPRGAKLDVFFLGTSRSEFINNLHPEVIRRDPYTNQREKKILGRADYNLLGVYKASEFLRYYLSLRALLEAGPRPDLIAVEIGPELYNDSAPISIQRIIARNHIERKYLLDVFRLVTKRDLKHELLNRYLFPTYALKIRPETYFANKRSGKTYMRGAHIAALVIHKRSTLHIPKNWDFGDRNIDTISKKDYAERIQGMTDNIEKKTFLRNYKFSRDELNFLDAVLELSAKNKIPAVVWTAHVHKSLDDAAARAGYYRLHHGRVKKMLKRRKAPFIDFRRVKPPCRWFVDASHYSPRCYPWIMTRLLEFAGASYPEIGKRLNVSPR